MSSRQNIILGVLSYDAPLTKAAIVEQTGFEDRQVANDMNALRVRGEVERAAGGWILAGATPTEPKARTHIAVERVEPHPPAANKKPRPAVKESSKANKKARPAHKQTTRPSVPVLVETEPEPIEVGFFGDYVILKRADVGELLATLERWRDVARAVA